MMLARILYPSSKQMSDRRLQKKARAGGGMHGRISGPELPWSRPGPLSSVFVFPDGLEETTESSSTGGPIIQNSPYSQPI